MAKAKTSTQKLSLDATLQALDRRDFGYYDKLTPEEKKAYSPFVLMRYMSSLSPQSSMQSYAVIATNDLVNLGFFNLGKHPELQHMLMCLAGTGRKQYRPYMGAKAGKGSKTKVVDEFLMELYPGCNATELAILKSQLDANSLKQLGKDAGLSDKELKELVEDGKKLEHNS
jgi:hypothetical protein